MAAINKQISKLSCSSLTANAQRAV